ncbi:MAG: hypothetical protein HY748_00140 [Elusimicrobia bacterium]|nr:hypothetical protein [Elusimicrobiota bacterium]
MNRRTLLVLCAMSAALGYLPRVFARLHAGPPPDLGAADRAVRDAHFKALQEGPSLPAGQREELRRLLKTLNASASPADDRELEAQLRQEIRRLLLSTDVSTMQGVDAQVEAELKKDIAHIQVPIMSKLVAMLQMSQDEARAVPGKVRERWRGVREAYARRRPLARGVLWGVPIAAVFAMALAFVYSPSSWSLALGRAGFVASVAWLAAASLAAAVFALMAKTDPWPGLPRELVVPALSWLAFCAGFLKLTDEGSSFWDDILAGLAGPCCSLCFVEALLRLPVPFAGR